MVRPGHDDTATRCLIDQQMRCFQGYASIRVVIKPRQQMPDGLVIVRVNMRGDGNREKRDLLPSSEFLQNRSHLATTPAFTSA